MFFDPGLATAAENESASTARAAKEELILPWCNDYETGIVQIDLQHHRLVELINLLGKSGMGMMLRPKISTNSCMKSRATWIITSDARKLSWPGIMSSIITSSTIRSRMVPRSGWWSTARFVPGWPPTLSDLCQGLARWLESHIHAEDKMLGEQIVAINRGSTPIEAYRQAMLSRPGGTLRPGPGVR